jgi:hypothetical protein
MVARGVEEILENSDDAKERKKLRRAAMVTTGLAAVATIHAAHSVHQGVEKRKKRHKAVEEGKMSPEEARKLRMKANLSDAASVGIAALGVRGAYSEWKEAKEKFHEHDCFKNKCAERHNKRLQRNQKRSQSHGPSRSSQSNGSPDDYHYYDENPYGYDYGRQSDMETRRIPY